MCSRSSFEYRCFIPCCMDRNSLGVLLGNKGVTRARQMRSRRSDKRSHRRRRLQMIVIALMVTMPPPLSKTTWILMWSASTIILILSAPFAWSCMRTRRRFATRTIQTAITCFTVPAFWHGSRNTKIARVVAASGSLLKKLWQSAKTIMSIVGARRWFTFHY